MTPAKDEAEGISLIATNRKAFHDYFISDKVEAGIVLRGTEVKALREGGCNLKDSYARVTPSGEAELLNFHISPYRAGNRFNMDPTRSRRLLLHKRETLKLGQRLREKGLTLVALRVYFRRGIAKLELGLGKGKAEHDKRAAIKDREGKMEAASAMKVRRRE
jgi:SsrA-binding protein